MDLRGHGLSDAPTEGYDPDTFAEDVLAVAEGSGLLEAPDDRVVLAGHGFGAIVAAWAAASMGERCAGLVLVDGGWEVARGGDRHRRRRIPARPRRAARGHALDGGVPGRSRGLRPGDLGCRPAARRPGVGRRDACRQGRPGDPAARGRGERPGDVPVRPARDARRASRAGRRASPPPTTRRARGRAPWPPPRTRAPPRGSAGSAPRRSSTTGTT